MQGDFSQAFNDTGMKCFYRICLCAHGFVLYWLTVSADHKKHIFLMQVTSYFTNKPKQFD